MRTCTICVETKSKEGFNKGRPECRECSKKIQKEAYWRNKGRCIDITEKTCKKCGMILPISKFDKKGCAKDGYRQNCKDCTNELRKEWRYKRGDNELPSPTHARNVWLGITIGEEVASRYFKNPRRAPYGTPGYDLICQNGFKIDVKLSTLNRNSWTFSMQNRTGEKPDYYLMIAMESGDTLTPRHIWLIPVGATVGNRKLCERQSISVSPSTVSKLAKYEKPIDKLNCICDTMHNNISNEVEV